MADSRSETPDRILLLRAFEMLGVDAIDDLQMPRQDALEQCHRPGLERLRQQRVIGVGERSRP